MGKGSRTGGTRTAASRQRSAVSQQVELTKLYAELPPMKCKGLCHITCVTVPIIEAEQARIRRWHRRTLPVLTLGNTAPCAALSADKRCTVYPDRPMICRLWGAVESMACPYGCVPEGGHLSNDQGRELSARLFELAGDNDKAARIRSGMQAPGPERGPCAVEDGRSS